MNESPLRHFLTSLYIPGNRVHALTVCPGCGRAVLQILGLYHIFPADVFFFSSGSPVLL